MKILKRKTLAALLAFSLLASLLPLGAQPAQAAAPSGQTIYVGDENVTSGGYWTTDASGNVTAYSGEGAPTDNYIYYNAADNTLTLHNATIKESVSSGASTYVMGAAIGVLNQNGAAELTITLDGTNTIEDVSTGIFVLAHSSSTGDASLTITGDGSLEASGGQHGILVQSNSSKATLTIQNADVTAENSSYFGDGVTVRADERSEASLSVDGGSLTASGRKGILFPVGTPQLTVDNSAIVRASNGIGAGINEGSVTPGGTGIVFNGNDGTVYGSVTLREDLTIGEGESLNIPDGARLNTDGKLTVDGGTLNGTPSGDVTYKVTDVSLNKTSLTLTEGGSETLAATITPNNATNQNVTWKSSNPSVATVDESGKVTAVAPGEATITVTTEDGSKTATCTVIVHTATTITTQPQSVSVTEGQSATFSVAASGDNLRYQWQINSGNGWSDITGATDASYTIDRTTTAMSGNQYRCIVIGDGGETTSSAATLTVRPYEPPYTGKYSYEVSTSVGDHGSLTVDRYATEGDEVTITVTPDDAYLLDDLSVTAGGKEVALTAGGDGTFSFTMPSADVKISATFAEDPDWTEPEEPATDVSDLFSDIAANAWYKDAVQYAYDSGLMTGVSANEFAPEATTTRAMIVSMLARLESVESAESAGFTDVAADDWYATAVNWAAASGITSGTGDGNFSPNTAITREQLAAILMNYAQYKGQDTSARATLDTYNDATAISSWANDVMSWAVAEGLISGVTADTLQPQGAATRAQVAAILQRFLSE